MKKKSVAIISVIILISFLFMTHTLAASEVSNLDTDYSKTIDVTAVTSGTDVYSVDVEWGDMTFNYAVGGWSTTNHEYTTESNTEWTSNTTNATDAAIKTGSGYTLGSGQVLVRNHSNQPVTTAYSVTSAKPAGFDDVTVSVNTAGGTIQACPVLGTAGNANVPYQTALVSLSGKPTNQTTATVGTLTIDISK